jgi:hypothetical protein
LSVHPTDQQPDRFPQFGRIGHRRALYVATAPAEEQIALEADRIASIDPMLLCQGNQIQGAHISIHLAADQRSGEIAPRQDLPG